MFVQSRAAINHNHKNGVAFKSRRGGTEILIQWANGDRRWCEAGDIVGAIRFVELEKSGAYENE